MEEDIHVLRLAVESLMDPVAFYQGFLFGLTFCGSFWIWAAIKRTFDHDS